MNSKQIAEVLYSMVYDMDFRNYEDTKEVEISWLKKEIDELSQSGILIKVLERIAEENE